MTTNYFTKVRVRYCWTGVSGDRHEATTRHENISEARHYCSTRFSSKSDWTIETREFIGADWKPVVR